MPVPASRPSEVAPRLSLTAPSDLPAQRLVTPPRVVHLVARVIVALFPVLVLMLLFVPWQQSATGSGRVVAWAPEFREQMVEAPIEGRIERWLVQEGEAVTEGQPLVELADNDPEWLRRLGSQAEAGMVGLSAVQEGVRSYEAKLLAEQAGRDLALAEYDAKIAGLLRKRTGEQAERDTAALQETRTATLRDEGIASQREWELARLKLDKAEAALSARDEEIAATRRARGKAAADADAKIAGVKAELEASRAKLADTEQKQLEIEGKVARQERQTVLAPRDGVVLALHGGPGGGQVKKGDALVSLVPSTTDRAVELFVDGNDMPLISAGDEVRLLFEGWPALQFVGLPGASGGTFEGRVVLVDPADDGKGKFRVVVMPPEGAVWPSADRLRQGVRAKGFVLLGRVSLGYEVWRQINGFPPLPDVDKGEKPNLPSTKKPRAPAELK